MDLDFSHRDDATLREYWLDHDGSARWNRAVEDELNRRGYVTRDADGIGRVAAHRPQSGDGPEGLKDLLTF